MASAKGEGGTAELTVGILSSFTFDPGESYDLWIVGKNGRAMGAKGPVVVGVMESFVKSALHLGGEWRFHHPHMIDMLVRLYDLPDSSELYEKIAGQGIILRRARAFEKHTLEKFARENFSEKWASEIAVAVTRQPVSCWIATREKEVLGFSCYETTNRGFFGPTGVIESARGTGLGKALLFKALESLRDIGYAYGVIGGVGPREFYEKNCGAIEIPGSDPGVYADILP